MQTPNNATTTDTGTPELVPYMNTLTSCVNKVVKDGYTDSFKIENKKLFSAAKENSYEPDQVKIVNFYRFEGQSDPGDNAIMYVIETTDGAKGTLIDAYGAYADEGVNKFMDEVEEINKKTKKGETANTL
ncbi:MAG: hypothetical protein P4L41_14445 [Flavipsychrobacter sp.]|nr:hypothetical protein [Flavipsychrobacter sp.]